MRDIAGLATVCGMVLDIPSIGIAKSTLVGTASAGVGLRELKVGKKTVGFVTGHDGATRYWSPGYSVPLATLKRIIEAESLVCLKSITEADRSSRQGRASSGTGNRQSS